MNKKLLQKLREYKLLMMKKKKKKQKNKPKFQGMFSFGIVPQTSLDNLLHFWGN